MKTIVAINIPSWPLSITLKPGLNIIKAPMNEINIADNLCLCNFSFKNIEAPIDTNM